MYVIYSVAGIQTPRQFKDDRKFPMTRSSGGNKSAKQITYLISSKMQDGVPVLPFTSVVLFTSMVYPLTKLQFGFLNDNSLNVH